MRKFQQNECSLNIGKVELRIKNVYCWISFADWKRGYPIHITSVNDYVKDGLVSASVAGGRGDGRVRVDHVPGVRSYSKWWHTFAFRAFGFRRVPAFQAYLKVHRDNTIKSRCTVQRESERYNNCPVLTSLRVLRDSSGMKTSTAPPRDPGYRDKRHATLMHRVRTDCGGNFLTNRTMINAVFSTFPKPCYVCWSVFSSAQ